MNGVVRLDRDAAALARDQCQRDLARLSRQHLANANGDRLTNVLDRAVIPLRERASISVPLDGRRGESVADAADGIEPRRSRVVEAAGKRRLCGRRKVCLQTDAVARRGKRTRRHRADANDGRRLIAALGRRWSAPRS